MTILIETMTKVKEGDKAFRIWKQVKLTPEISLDPLYCAALQRLCVENVNAVEVLDDKGDGYVLYKDWP